MITPSSPRSCSHSLTGFSPQSLRLQAGTHLPISQTGKLRSRDRERFLQVIRHVQGPAWDDLSVGLLLSLVTRCPCWLWMRCTRTCLGWSRTCTGMNLSHTPPTQLLPPSSVEPPLWAPPSTSGVASARGLGGKPLLVQGSA